MATFQVVSVVSMLTTPIVVKLLYLCRATQVYEHVPRGCVEDPSAVCLTLVVISINTINNILQVTSSHLQEPFCCNIT